MSERFVAYVYEDDYRQIQELVQQYQNIETGGDLFGLWEDESTVVIQQFIGPGKNCERTKTSFHQDIQYLGTVGSLITTEEGLCNVGEWHSHHQIGMPEPSAADRRTVFSNMPQLGLERFVLFIATIESKGLSGKKRSHDVKLRPFLFLRSGEKVKEGKIKIISGKNPHRHRLDSRARKAIEDGAEKNNNKKPATNGEENYDKSSQKQGEKKNGRKDENQSPNADSAAFRDREFPNLGSSFQRNASPQTAQPHSPDTQSTLWCVWKDSSPPGTAQERGIQKNTKPTGGVNSSHRNPDHQRHTQQTGQIPQSRDHGAEETIRAKPMKDRSNVISVGKVNGKGYF